MTLNTDCSGPEWVGLIRAFVAVIAAFLPGVTAGVQAGPLELSASSTGTEGLGVVTLVLAVAWIGLVLTIGVEEQGAVLTGIVGVIIGAVAVWKITEISGAASPGLALYLTVLGGSGLLTAGVWGIGSLPANRRSEFAAETAIACSFRFIFQASRGRPFRETA